MYGLTRTSQNQKGLFSAAPPWNRRCWRFNLAPALPGRCGLAKPSQSSCPLCKNLIGKILRLNAYPRAIYLLLIALTVLTTACQSSPTETEQWTPAYLQLQLREGKARVQWADSSEWMTVEKGENIAIEKKGYIATDAEEARFQLGDGSTLELGPETVIEVHSSRSFPHLEMALQAGSFLLTAQKPSYEITIPACPVTLLSIPSQIRVEVSDGTIHVAIEEGAALCTQETGTLMLPKCKEVYARPGEELEVAEFCDADATATASALTPSPTFSFWDSDETPTVTATATASPTPTLTRAVVIPTSTPMPPTNTPPPPPPPPPPTQPPPTRPPATNTPPPPPPPTNTSAPPTNTPLPPPTSTPLRATPTQPPPPTKPPPTQPPPTEPPPTDTPSAPPTP